MEQFLSTIEWMPVLVSFVLAYGLGWLWYSDKLFGKKWRQGKGSEVWHAPMWMPMSAQAGATFLFAILVNVFMLYNNVIVTVLVALTIACFIKANGLFGGKTKDAITVETLYILAMALIMIMVNVWL